MTHPILIAEDDQNMRELCIEAFERAGLPVITARNGRDAVALALEHHPAIILMDIQMPIMDGHEAMRKIREDEHWGSHAKVIYLTNFSDPEHVYEAVQNRSVDFIVKAHTPINEIVNRVRIAMYSDT